MALALVLLQVASTLALTQAAPPGDLLELSIAHLNDFHARFEPTSWSSGACEGDTTACVGGFARVYTAVNSLLAERPNAIYLNAGDNYQGTLWYTVHRWNVTAEFMNKLPTDAVTLGNHEFDNRIAGVVPFMEALKAPVVVSNIDDSLEPSFQGKYKKSVVIERAGRRIGIVGVIASNTKDISSPEQLKFLPEIESVSAEASVLKSQGVDIIIVLSHVGYEVDQEIAKAVPDVDVIVGGHSHTLLYTGTPPGGDVAAGPYPTMVTQASGRLVAVVQAAAYTKYLGNLTAWFDPRGELVVAEGNPILLDNSIVQDAGILRDMAPWQEAIDQLGQKEVGTTKVLLDETNGACRKGECNIGSLLTDAMVQEYVFRAEPGSWTSAAIALLNSGGIRSSIEETNNGIITYNDVVTCQPFENTIDSMELQGRHLRAILEQSVSKSRVSRAGNFSGQGFLQMSGLHVTFDIDQPLGKRVVAVSVLCAECRVPSYGPLDDDKWYRVIVPSFLAGGGDGYYVIPDNARNRTTGRVDINIFTEYFERNSPIIQGLDDRIQVIQ